MSQLLSSASAAVRQAQLQARTSLEQDVLGVALDLIEGELPNLLDLVHDLIGAYSKQCPDPRKDPLMARAQQVVERIEGLSWSHILAAQLAVDEVEE
jgi:hypothetical protein